jgi:hypothetical protein
VQKYRKEQKLWITDIEVDDLYQIKKDSVENDIQ